MLEVSDIHTYYGSSHVLSGVSISVAAGEAVGLLGRNGAGKTTTFRSIMGLTPPLRGDVRFLGKNLARRAPHEIANHGLGFVPQGRRLFGDLTVLENLQVAQRAASDGWRLTDVFELFPAVERFQDRPARTLSGGEQQMVAIARALMANPRLLLLDEPCEGLAPVVIEAIVKKLQDLRRRGMTILFSEQYIGFALALATRIYIIDKGLIQFEGTTQEFAADPEVRARYLAV